MWIPGHHEIEGNERADVEAKKAAMDPTLSQQFRHKPLKSARVRNIKAAAKEQWQKEWNEGTKTAITLRILTKRKGVKTGLKLYNAISSRRTVATLVRLGTGHCGLRHYLPRFNIGKSLYCECRPGKETVEHYLLECGKYMKQRKKLRKEVGMGRLTMDKLPGCPRNIKHIVQCRDGLITERIQYFHCMIMIGYIFIIWRISMPL